MRFRILILFLATFIRRGGCWTNFEEVSDSMRVQRDTNPNSSSTKPANPLWKSTWTDKLKQDLLLNYDKFARPMHHASKTSVTLHPAIWHIELDEKRSIMSIHCWVSMTWVDDKLRWDPSNYGGLNELHLADHEVWQPDIFPYNSATGSTIDHFGNSNLIAFGNGSIIWVPPSIFHVFCQLDYTRWPFDTQTCSLKMGSWTYNGEQVDLLSNHLKDKLVEESHLVPNSEWEFLEATVQRNQIFYPCCTTPYVDLTYTITIKRHSATYKALIITPASAIVLMTLATFWLPATSGDKLTLGGAAVFITCLFMLYFTQKTLVMAGSTPYLVSFYSKSLYLASFAVVIAVIVINIAKNPKQTPLPWILKRNLTGWLGVCLFIKNSEPQNQSKAEEMTDSQPVFADQSRHRSEPNSKIYQKDWIMLANAIDRIFFLLYCFAFTLLAVVYSV